MKLLMRLKEKIIIPVREDVSQVNSAIRKIKRPIEVQNTDIGMSGNKKLVLKIYNMIKKEFQNDENIELV